ncbi:hypothetical protein CLFO_06920 [Clostridium formicaceticum]|uniref:Uncharacterized protein n=1 Tax=Clostridium formicaceticum TaxID=1497 RepID=A0AAC9WG45_9CLOT|nr:hypothetical protein CLFO_06920 [Clostridium formicaceticum]
MKDGETEVFSVFQGKQREAKGRQTSQKWIIIP